MDIPPQVKKKNRLVEERNAVNTILDSAIALQIM